MAAMAMSCKPDILVLDEPTTALDVTTQIEVLAAIRKLIRDHGTAGLYISHDLAVVAQIANRILVLRHGKMVEEGESEQILQRPRQDYTRALVSIRDSGAGRPGGKGSGGRAGAGAAPGYSELCSACSGRQRHHFHRAARRDCRGGRRIR